jgi:L-ascorbate metabolism protein UlaG (beta-lactamase superfamily)
MQITYYGHSCFLIETNGKRLLTDPFISHNPLAGHIDVNSIRCDYVLITHGHSDHIADVDTIMAHNPEAVIVGIWEVHAYFSAKGYTTHGMNKGGWWSFDFGRVKLVQAVHSSSFPDGSYAGEPAGFVLDTPDGVLYIAGDTALTLDMQLIPRTCPPLDAAILPIGSNFTMDVDDAVLAAEFVQCTRVIACHFDTFGFIKVDHAAAQKAFEAVGITLVLPAVGDVLPLKI